MSEPVHYSEERCALRWPLVFHGFFWPLLLIGSFVALLLTDNSSVFMPGVILGIVGSVSLGGLHLAEDRPIGIRVDAAGIWIGGIQRTERLKARGRTGGKKLPRARAHRRQVFFCPWDAVQRVEVVSDHQEIRKIAKVGRDVGSSRLETATGTIKLGLLTAPYMRAAIVINVDLTAASVPEFRPPEQRSFWKTSAPQQFAASPVWSAPTRHPEKLRAALEQAGSQARR
ncbi:hypothetical protein ACIPW9_31790 [Streptomyces sp. NPDC090052]|uniref:hypothetical protein n=1 Tax=unclassified Streptomyces TaxID=2593676 RepID=UPI0022597A60|nr:hypothetical protein [Streptomyces sp. NBC_01306]MCX4724632.1 hypothetical protein [Streptomyces sp. NBC_01306]